MESFDLLLEIEKFMTEKGLSHSDSITDLIESLLEDTK